MGKWLQRLKADPKKQPTTQQWSIINLIHNRCETEHKIESADGDLQRSMIETAPPPLFRMIHGLPGSGKSQILKWLRSYFTEVWLWEEGIHFQFLAPLNSMADGIGAGHQAWKLRVVQRLCTYELQSEGNHKVCYT